MPNKNVIGLGGLLRAGKDEVADHLVDRHGYTKVFMSEPLLKMSMVLDPIIPTPGGMERFSNIVNIVGYTQAKQYPEVRRFLQALGTDVGRNMIDQNLWVSLASENIKTILMSGGKAVLTGVRFQNELNMVEVLGGSKVWVERPEVRVKADHISELSLNHMDFEHEMLNDGTLEDLYATVDKWVSA